MFISLSLSSVTLVMSGRLFKHRRFLQDLIHNPDLIRTSTPAQIGCIVEILHNIGKIAFTAKEKRKLASYLPTIRKISNIRKAANARESLVQHGGAILPALIPAALSLLLSAL